MSTSDDSEVLTLVLMRFEAGLTVPVEGSVPITADCGHMCWIAPSSLTAHLSEQATRTSCANCFLAGHEASDLQDVKVGLAPGGRQEVAQVLGEERASALMDHFNIKERE